MSYGTGVGLGFMTALVGGILGSIFAYVLFAIIDPSLPEQLLGKALEEAIAKNPEVEQNLDMVEGMMRKMMSPTVIAIMGVVSSAIGGIIISLILAAIFKKDKPMFEEAQAQGSSFPSWPENQRHPSAPFFRIVLRAEPDQWPRRCSG